MYNIVALIQLSRDVGDPKINGIRSGYAPHHKFERINYLVSGFHTYVDGDLHFPGENIVAKIVFPSWEFFRDQVQVGDRFDIREMDRIVGYGVVREIILDKPIG